MAGVADESEGSPPFPDSTVHVARRLVLPLRASHFPRERGVARLGEPLAVGAGFVAKPSRRDIIGFHIRHQPRRRVRSFPRNSMQESGHVFYWTEDESSDVKEVTAVIVQFASPGDILLFLPRYLPIAVQASPTIVLHSQ